MEVGYRSFALLFALAILTAFFAEPAARAQVPGACCTITAINTSTGVVSAKLNSTGATFAFKLANPQGLVALSVGQAVYANFTTRQVSLNGKSMAGTMVVRTEIAPARAVPGLAGGAKGPQPTPCCTIVAIAAATDTITTRQKSDGQTFSFKVSQQEIPNLKVGMAVAFGSPSTGSGIQAHLEKQNGGDYQCTNYEYPDGGNVQVCDLSTGEGPVGNNPSSGGPDMWSM